MRLSGRADSEIEFRRHKLGNHVMSGEYSSRTGNRMADKFSVPVPLTSNRDDNSMTVPTTSRVVMFSVEITMVVVICWTKHSRCSL